jgi:hypothetical protein
VPGRITGQPTTDAPRTDGFDSPTVRAAIAKREKEVADMVAQAAGCRNNSVRTQVRNLRKFVEESMGNIRSLLSGNHTNPIAMRMALSKHVDQIVLLPEDDGQVVKYRGAWKLLGNWGGAEGQS